MTKLARLSVVLLTQFAERLARAGDEPAVKGEGRVLAYLRALHARVHRDWADNFLAMATAQLPKDHPVNTSSRAVDLEVVISAEGKLSSVQVAKSSGAADFDAAALEVIKAAPPFGMAPEEALSDDGKAHVLWTFARDDRRCSGLSMLNNASTIALAVPMLVAQGREGAAIERLRGSDEKERELGFQAFARAWLDRAETDKELAPRVALANALAGDGRGAERLRQALEKGQQVDLAARGLAALKIPLCPLVKDKLGSVTSDTRDFLLSVLRFSPDGDCLPWMVSFAQDRKAAQAERLVAIVALGSREEPEARGAVKELLNDRAAAIRGAAILADARAGAGKGAMFRLTPLLHDRSVEIRAAAAAALVRVGGEPALSQLFLLFKERDPRPYEAVAEQLAWLTGEASADMLGRFLRKDDGRIRLAGALALARRHDSFAAKTQAVLAASPDLELRFLAGTSVAADKRVAAAAAPEGYAWTASFAALAEGSGKIAAVDWMLAQFQKLDPATRIDLIGKWLASTRGTKREEPAGVVRTMHGAAGPAL